MKPEKPTLKAVPWVNRRKFEQFMGNAALVATFSLPRRAEGAFFPERGDMYPGTELVIIIVTGSLLCAYYCILLD